ncbi:type II secretion system protein [Dechloromonas denitrificans]|uniref:type II secretion system protein n=1 Tax=Dechloromonas denitrificans TaxID=281362 RepID=UPI001CF83E5A|nr:type II secretion system protein [Dechloromonas denitrificans]UCV11044.1 type II secretion system protein [Dechloromonas denitrificans]
MPKTADAPQMEDGFSLVELSIAIVIITILSSSMLRAYTIQRKANQIQETQKQLEEIRETLIGHAIVSGRLPCPASPTIPETDPRAGMEDRNDMNTPCNRNYGVIPWATLGIAGHDVWGRRLTYFVSSKFSGPTPSTGLSSFNLSTGSGSDNAGTANVKPGISSGSNIASDLPAIIVSHGPNGLGGFLPSGQQIPGAKGDELENANNTQTFIFHAQDETFDDQVIWVVGSVLKSRLVLSGRLP